MQSNLPYLFALKYMYQNVFSPNRFVVNVMNALVIIVRV